VPFISRKRQHYFLNLTLYLCIHVISRSVFELNLTNTGDDALSFDTAAMTVTDDSVGDTALWADVRFLHEDRVLEVGGTDGVSFTIPPGESELAYVQFQGSKTPGLGTYTASWRIPTNDPNRPVTEVPLSFEVRDGGGAFIAPHLIALIL
jgi:hypothetical protein